MPRFEQSHPKAVKRYGVEPALVLPEKQTLLTPPFQTSRLQNCERINSNGFKLPSSFVICHGTLRKLTQRFQNQMSVRKAAYSQIVPTNPDQHISNW